MPLSSHRFSIPLYLVHGANQTNKDFQGVKKNEIGWISAKIYTQPQPNEILHATLETELAAVGFQVLPPDACVGNEIPKIYPILQEYFVEPEVKLFLARICAVVKADIVIALPQGKQWKRTFTGMNSIYTPIFWYTFLPMEGDAIYQAALEGAMNDWITQAVPSICDFLATQPLIPPVKNLPPLTPSTLSSQSQ